jgi:hypothetical protein
MSVIWQWSSDDEIHDSVNRFLLSYPVEDGEVKYSLIKKMSIFKEAHRIAKNLELFEKDDDGSKKLSFASSVSDFGSGGDLYLAVFREAYRFGVSAKKIEDKVKLLNFAEKIASEGISHWYMYKIAYSFGLKVRHLTDKKLEEFILEMIKKGPQYLSDFRKAYLFALEDLPQLSKDEQRAEFAHKFAK